VSRPSASITFLTYEHLESAIRFYGDTLGLPLIEDQGWAKVYRISGSAHVGLVASPEAVGERLPGAGVLLSIVVDDVADVDAWYERLCDEPEIEIAGRPAGVHGIPVYSFFLRDPGGYRLEIQAFTQPAILERFLSFD